MQTVAACVLALDQGQVVIVEQYRASLGQVQAELPGGNMEPGETPEETARRELLEETGYACSRLEGLGQAPVWGKLVAVFQHVAEGRWMASEMVHALLLARLKGLL